VPFALVVALILLAALMLVVLNDWRRFRIKGREVRGPITFVGPIMFGLFILWGFGGETVGLWLRTDVEGVIVASRDVPPNRPPRYATEYTIRGGDGQERVFWSGATDGSLPRSMPVGTQLRKQRWHLEYERDGKTVGFPYIFYSLALGIAVIFVLRGVWNFRAQRRQPRRSNADAPSSGSAT
jgi:hypothetical protein